MAAHDEHTGDQETPLEALLDVLNRHSVDTAAIQRAIRDQVGMVALSAFNAPRDEATEQSYGEEALGRLSGTLVAFLEMMLLLQKHHADETVGRYLDEQVDDHLNLIQEQWIRTNPLLTFAQRGTVQTREERLRFRIDVFNDLCNQKKLGLTQRDVLATHEITFAYFKRHACNALGRHWHVFDDECSAIDGGHVRSLLGGVGEEVKNGRDHEYIARVVRRLDERVSLMREISVQDNGGGTLMRVQPPQSLGMERFITEEGGDVGVKIAALVMLVVLWGSFDHGFLSLLASGALWNLRGIMRARDIDFGDWLREVIRKLRTAPKVGWVYLAGFLAATEGIGKLSPPAKEWLRAHQINVRGRRPARLGLTPDERRAALLNGFDPVPSATKIMERLAEGGAKKLLPPSGAALREGQSDVASACRTVLNHLATASHDVRKLTPQIRRLT